MLKKTLEKNSEELQTYVSRFTKNKHLTHLGVETLKLDRDKWDDYTELFDCKLSLAQTEYIELREYWYARHVRKFDLLDIPKYFYWRFLFDEFKSNKNEFMTWETVFMNQQRQFIDKEMAQMLELDYLYES